MRAQDGAPGQRRSRNLAPCGRPHPPAGFTVQPQMQALCVRVPQLRGCPRRSSLVVEKAFPPAPASGRRGLLDGSPAVRRGGNPGNHPVRSDEEFPVPAKGALTLQLQKEGKTGGGGSKTMDSVGRHKFCHACQREALRAQPSGEHGIIQRKTTRRAVDKAGHPRLPGTVTPGHRDSRQGCGQTPAGSPDGDPEGTALPSSAQLCRRLLLQSEQQRREDWVNP